MTINEFEIHTIVDGMANTDGVSCKSKGIACSYTHDDSVTFVYVYGSLYVLPGKNFTHKNICDSFHVDWENTKRVHGRFWTKRKIISFWAASEASNLYLPSSNEVSEIVTKLKNSRYGYDVSDYTLFFKPYGTCLSVEIPIEEYIDYHLTGKEDSTFWINKFRVSLIQKPNKETVAKKQQQRQWSDNERRGREQLQNDTDSPYNDQRYSRFLEEGKIRLTESDIRKIVKEVIKKLL